MLTNPQKGMLKRAQSAAKLPDSEYREALQLVAGVTSSTDPGLGDRHFDKIMGYFEAIYWRKYNAREVSAPALKSVFRQRGYWKAKNTQQETSRDRFTGQNLEQEIDQLKTKLAELGCNSFYVGAIERNVTGGSRDQKSRWKFKAALERTVESKLKKKEGVECPF